MAVSIHHFVISCRSPSETCELFCQKFSFRKFAICKQQGQGVKIAAKISDDIVAVFEERPKNASHDSVYDVALVVEDFVEKHATAVKNGAHFIQSPTRIEDQYGYVDYAIVKVPAGNIQHTLLDVSHYGGQFLPGYQPINDVENVNSPTTESNHQLVTHIDHVTCICHQNTTVPLLNWYQKCFNFSRFTINADEEEDGYTLNDLHIKMIAAQYWLCTEQGIQSSNGRFKFLLAEPLDISVNNHVNGFLKEQEGSGIQHIALHTENITNTVGQMKAAGTAFVTPPDTYYNNLKQADIHETVKLSAEDLKENNVLLDFELDKCENEGHNSNGQRRPDAKYLLQAFTRPLLDKKRSFFMEVIQRFGARGFGGSNIRKSFTAMEDSNGIVNDT
ncbi:4-hydroxyphenylpyruvate dioxygenase [Trichoplax sp. H2]|nr:4-hydroxyphenylpyruvate dioxygenase [Trichoplax sp. H2]|eukprot:RDD43323.1 4-hydroxyphenylpyruvate dioxygenase [Trichoplax sp. H2]